jgi:hypothetical protein
MGQKKNMLGLTSPGGIYPNVRLRVDPAYSRELNRSRWRDMSAISPTAGIQVLGLFYLDSQPHVWVYATWAGLYDQIQFLTPCDSCIFWGCARGLDLRWIDTGIKN